MGLKQSTAIKHTAGNLVVISCSCRGTVGSEILYEGDGKNVQWIACEALGGSKMIIPSTNGDNEQTKKQKDYIFIER